MSDIIKDQSSLEAKMLIIIGLASVVASFVLVEVIVRLHHLF